MLATADSSTLLMDTQFNQLITLVSRPTLTCIIRNQHFFLKDVSEEYVLPSDSIATVGDKRKSEWIVGMPMLHKSISAALAAAVPHGYSPATHRRRRLATLEQQRWNGGKRDSGPF